MDRVVPFIENAVENDKPFFSVIWFQTPHLPVVADEDMMAEYSEYSHVEQIYYASITGMDEQVGRLWKKLAELGASDNTMIWFCSDNGPERGTPGTSGPFRERKRSLYEGGVRVPAFCVWPAEIESGQITDFPAFTSDYLPTINEILHIDYPPERPIDGISLTEVLKGDMSERTEPMGFQFREKMSWVNHEYKLISTNSGEDFELYNLLDDPEENKNIIAEYPAFSDSMKKDLFRWIKSCQASARGDDY